jgi:hypothetical protein
MNNPAQFKPGEVFQKGWRIRNSGSCTWDATYTLVYAGSSPLNAPVGGSPVAIAGQVKPGETYDIYATITAPAQPGVYQSFWTMRNPKGMLFGDRLWAGFQVVSPVTPTPMPEKPVINNFAVTPSSVIEGQCVTLSWNFSGAVVMARIFRDGQVILQDMPFSGSASDCPPGTGQKEYKLQVDSEHAGSTVSTQFVEVVPPARPTATPEPTQVPPPVINSFSVDFEKIIWGQCVTLSWQYSGGGQVTTTLERNGQSIGGNLPPQGTQKDCPPPGNSDYHLVVDSATSGSTDSSASTYVLLPSPSSYTITFNMDGTLEGKADCNQFSGSYTVSGTAISIAITTSTRNMCQDQSMNELFMGFLPQMNQFAVNSEGKLELTQVDASGRIVSGMLLLNGGPVPQPFEGSPQEGAQAIIGILWQWEKMLPAQ